MGDVGVIEDVDTLAVTLWQRIESFQRTGTNRIVVYLGRAEVMALEAAMLVIPTKKCAKTFGGYPFYEVNQDNYVHVAQQDWVM